MKKIAIIGSDFINALDIYKFLKRADFKGDIYVIESNKYKLLTSLYANNITTIRINNPNELIKFLLNLKKEVPKYLFLTNEIYHTIIYENDEKLKKSNVIYYFGKNNPKDIIDKNKFTSLFKTDNNISTPLLYKVGDNIDFPVVIKFKNSFIEGKRTLPVKIVNNKNDYHQYLKKIHNKGFSDSDIMIQEKLSSKPKDNISIVGWFDNTSPVFFQTRKIIQHPKKGGTGDLIELMELNEDLKKKTIYILNKVNYIGPFEIEFIKEMHRDNYKLLEMNPRFWMQHGLAGINSGNLLIQKYLGINNKYDIETYKYWVNLPHYIKLLLMFDLKAWSFLPKILMNSYSTISFKELIKFFLYKIK